MLVAATLHLRHRSCLDCRFPEPDPVSPPVLGFTDVDFAYPNGPKLFKGLNFGLDMESRLAIVGPNGMQYHLYAYLFPLHGEYHLNVEC